MRTLLDTDPDPLDELRADVVEKIGEAGFWGYCQGLLTGAAIGVFGMMLFRG